jgi:hypothetical protein
MASCQDPTQLTLVLSTNARCHDELRSTAIYVGGSLESVNDKVQTSSPVAQTDTCNSGSIGTLVVTPGDSHGAVVVIGGFNGKPPTDCVEGHYENCIIARRSFTFIKHTPLSIPIQLERDCLNVPCDVHSTCHNGQCYAATISCSDNGTCTKPGDGDAGPVDGGARLYPDGQPEPLEDGSSIVPEGSIELPDGNIIELDSGNPDLDSGQKPDVMVPPPVDAGDSGIPLSDAGLPIYCSADGGALVVTNCGINPTCGSPGGCCAFGGTLQCVASVALCAGLTTYCCNDAQCPGVMTCQGGGKAVNLSRPHVFLPVLPGGSAGTCM